jgi:hypothetical protein
MARTRKDKTGHTHKVPETKLTGRTSVDDGHDHFFDWKKERTGEGNKHDHQMPKVPRAVKVKLS